MLCPLGSRNSFLPQKAIAQTRQQTNANRSAWQVTLPPRAKVRRKKGSSLTEIKEGLRRAKEREQFILESPEAVHYKGLERATIWKVEN